MRVKLAYGRAGLPIDVSDDRVTVVQPTYIRGLSDEQQVLTQSLREPIQSPPLRSLVRSKHQVAIAVCDITRPMPSSRVLPALLRELNHVPEEQIVILVATGTHRPNTPAELEDLLGGAVVRRYRIVNHNSSDANMLEYLGKSAGGAPIWLNRIWTESDIRITTGFVDVTLNEDGHITAVFAGRQRAAHQAACRFVRHKAMTEVPHLFEVVVTTNSGYLKVSRFRGRFISAVYVGLGFNTASVGEEQDFRLPNVNGHRKCQGYGH